MSYWQVDRRPFLTGDTSRFLDPKRISILSSPHFSKTRKRAKNLTSVPNTVSPKDFLESLGADKLGEILISAPSQSRAIFSLEILVCSDNTELSEKDRRSKLTGFVEVVETALTGGVELWTVGFKIRAVAIDAYLTGYSQAKPSWRLTALCRTLALVTWTILYNFVYASWCWLCSRKKILHSWRL